MPFAPMVHEVDPRDMIFKKAGMKKGIIPGFKLMRNDVLCGVYFRTEKTKSGIYMPDSSRGEDAHQGKAACVLMLGPGAFVSDDNYRFEEKVEVGDWVALWVSEGRRIIVNGQLCRIVRDQDIIMKIPAPDSIF